MKTIIFDETCPAWRLNADYNLLYLRLQAVDIEDLFKHRGYVYLNQIYETFGIGWDPSDENVCYLLGSGAIEFKFEPLENGRILIHVS